MTVADPRRVSFSAELSSDTSGSAWCEKDIATLTDMWDAGASATQIAERLSVSRNAVIGKIHRLRKGGHPFKRPSTTREQILATAKARRLVERPRRTRAQAEEDNAIRMRVKLAALKPEKPAKPEPIALETVWLPLAGVKPVALENLTAITCRWPIQVESSTEHHFCGALKVGGPYCLHHARVGRSAFQPAKVESLAKYLLRREAA